MGIAPTAKNLAIHDTLNVLLIKNYPEQPYVDAVFQKRRAMGGRDRVFALDSRNVRTAAKQVSRTVDVGLV